ncbi:SDR family NAD(P)-dependent oxidoreductase [Novosphingobium tardum]|jgi:NAD(P)-dependent dehydrogenase (short-subunit alcohol dehydrogenase family)|uniref:SDR family NAD(P)-dependent oxidoreductase n=1 Tax=Novosphingobium tardum TaxID=1538021 RepID=A0ABV8RJM8_9SPHN|nr:SDR family oxidoreductase [Alphaproteobacteria bacterium]
MSGRLKGKVAVVMGCGSSGPGLGTGKAIALMFAKEGAKILGFDKNAEAAEETMEIIRASGGECSSYIGDVTVASDIANAVENCTETFGRIDILVNNIGIGPIGGVVDQSEEVWDAVFDINLKSVFLACKYCIPVMIKGGGGAIVNISSLAALRWTGVPLIAYAGSKAAMNQMTKHIAMQYAANNIRANAILPGLLYTPMMVETMKRHYGEDVQQILDIRAKICPGGAAGDANDIAYAAVYLASDEAKFVTGVDLLVDGGVSCQIDAPNKA